MDVKLYVGNLSYSTTEEELRALFAQDPERFHKFSLRFEDVLFDYSKNRITEETMRLPQPR